MLGNIEMFRKERRPRAMSRRILHVSKRTSSVPRIEPASRGSICLSPSLEFFRDHDRLRNRLLRVAIIKTKKESRRDSVKFLSSFYGSVFMYT